MSKSFRPYRELKNDAAMSISQSYLARLHSVHTNNHLGLVTATSPLNRIIASSEMPISTLLLCYNDQEVIEKAALSLVAQATGSTKIYALLHGSTDQSKRILESILLKDSIYSTKANIKSYLPATFLNKVVSGDLISVLYSDDEYLPSRNAIARALFRTKPAIDAIFFSSHFVYPDQTPVPMDQLPLHISANNSLSQSSSETLKTLLTIGNTLHPCAMVIKQNVYRQIGGVDPYSHRIGDLGLFVKLLLGEFKVYFSPLKMQRITVWPCGRNESALNSSGSNLLQFERYKLYEYLLEEMPSKALITKCPLLFCSTVAGADLAEYPLRLWLIGEWLMKSHQIELRLLGYKAFRSALDQDSSGVVRRYVHNTYNITASQVFDRVDSVYIPSW